MQPDQDVRWHELGSDGIDLTTYPIGHKSRLSKIVTITALGTDTNAAEQLENVQPEWNNYNVTHHRELDPLLQPSLASDSHAAPVPARQQNQGESSTELTPRERSFSASALFVLRKWWKEWALVLVAIGILIVITVILRLYNQQPQPKWRLGLNLNTIIAVLATLLRSSLVTVVEEVVSQAKWCWQHRRLPAQHLAHFDEASRGPLGALLLCFNIPALLNWKLSVFKYSNSVVIACSVSVLSLAVGAFTQQAIKTVPCSRPVPGTNASSPVASYAHPFMNDTEFNWSTWGFDTSTKARIVSAFGSPNSTRPMFLQNCTTGNCTFESLNGITHVTSGFCSRCVETTNLLVSETNVPLYFEGINNPIKFVVRLPSSPSLMLAFGADHGSRLGFAVNADSNPLEALPGSVPSNFTVAINVASITRAACSPGSNCSGLWLHNHNASSRLDGRSDDWSDFNVVSVSCGLYPCARHMKAEAISGRFTETIVREEFYTTSPVYFDPNETLASEPYVFIPPCWENNTRYDKQPTDDPILIDMDSHVVQLPPCAYGVSQASLSQLQKFVSSFAYGNCSAFLDVPLDTVDCRSGLASLDNPFCMTTSESPLCQTDFWWLENLYNSGNATFESISTVMDNLALAITDSIRTQSYPGVRLVSGTIWESTVCNEFNWPWICFPAALVALTAISLASIMSVTAPRKDEPPIWKSSILPLVYSQATGPDRSVYGNSLKEIENSAKEDILVLEKVEERWEFKITKRDDEDKSKSSQELSK